MSKNASPAMKPFNKPQTYSCIIFRLKELVPNASANVIATLETHRDQVLAVDPFGRKTVENYYATTSQWVEDLDRCANRDDVAKKAWAKLETVAHHIEAKKNDQAFKAFGEFVDYVKSATR